MPGYLYSEEYGRNETALRARLEDALGYVGGPTEDSPDFPAAIGFVADIPSVHIEAEDLRDYAVDIAQGLEHFRQNDPRFDLAIDGEELVEALSADLVPAIQEAISKAVVSVAEQATQRYGRQPMIGASRRPRLGM